MVEEVSYVEVDDDGVLRVAGTLVPLDSIVTGFARGDSPDQIQLSYPALSLEQVYGTITYYLGRRQEVDEYIRLRRAETEESPAMTFAGPRGPRFEAGATAIGPADGDSGGNGHSSDTVAAGLLDSTDSVSDDSTAGITIAPGDIHPHGDVNATIAPSSSDQTQAPGMRTQAPGFQTAPPRPLHPAHGTMPGSTGVQTQGEFKRSLTPSEIPANMLSSDPMLRQIETSGRLGGFEIVNKLGQGGMGAVYLARQVSLDRKVAVKVLSSQLSGDASFVARFTREAFAAAQLTHHNIVQIYDIGEESSVHFFSMEFVEGKTLNGLVKSGGRIEPASAVNYILQAARGLKFAHDHAMIHRDIKPDNLLLNNQGLVKVADLGLVKRKGTADEKNSGMQNDASDASMTGAAAAMGTPAYMPPEQATDAATVDGRADIYSLGCTLYDLLTGRPPFTGKTAIEVLTKHKTEAVTPPDKIVRDVPKELSAILLKMMAKLPEDRYPSMDEVIKALEEYVAARSGGKRGAGGPFAPGEEHVKSLELSVNQFNAASWDFLRKFVIWSFFGVGIFGMFSLLLSSHLKGLAKALWEAHLKIAEGVFGLMFFTFLSYILLAGIGQRAYLSRQLRQALIGAKVIDWIKAGLAAIVIIGALSVLHLQWVWLACVGVSFVVALAFHTTIDRALKKERRTSLTQLEAMLKTMRQQGMDEDSLRQFVCDKAGRNWEEVYEELFGFEEMMQARRRMGLAKDQSGRWGLFRNGIMDAIDARVRRQHDEKQIEMFARIEERKLIEQGIDKKEAAEQARKIAQNIVAKARQIKEVIDEGDVDSTQKREGAKVNRLLVDETFVGTATQGEKPRYIQRLVGGLLETILSPQVRVIAGLVMLSVFIFWMKKDNPNLPGAMMKRIIEFVDRSQTRPPEEVMINIKQPVAPLTAEDSTVRAANDAAGRITQMSPKTREQVVETENKIFLILGSWQGGLAGILLLVSSLFRGPKMGPLMLVSTLLILVIGRYVMIPTHGIINPGHTGMISGSILAAGSFIFGRR